MIVRYADMKRRDLVRCHEGIGTLSCLEMLVDYTKTGAGIAFVHDDIIPAGVTIGVHTHRGDEEIYIVLEGEGTFIDDGESTAVKTGDLMITRNGHSHGLINDGSAPMRLLVVGVLTGKEM